MKRKRKLLPDDFECRGLIVYARGCGKLAPNLSATYHELDDGRRVVAVRSDGVALKAYEIKQSRLRNILLPPEFW